MEQKKIPSKRIQKLDIPTTESTTKEIPSIDMQKRSAPSMGNPENSVMIGNRLVEIKPTKLKYQRNGMASFYRMLEMYPLADLLLYSEEIFGNGKDGDKAVFDFLIAATDEPELIAECYDELDTGTVEKILLIFRRVNKIDEKEEKQKKTMNQKKD